MDLRIAWGVGLVAGGMAAYGGTVTNLPVADTTLFQYSPDGNLGAATTLVVGTTANGAAGRALLRFACTNIPPGAVIQSAELRFEVVKAPQMRPPEPSFFEVRRMLAPWQEGQGQDLLGAPAKAGEATWNSRAHGSIPWAAAGGRLDSEIAGTASGTSELVLRTGQYSVASTPPLVADVQRWVDQPESNHGWMLLSQSEAVQATARRLGSREEPFVAPRLVVSFTPPPPPPSVVAEARVDGFRLKFAALPGLAYRVEFRPDWSAGEWLNWTNLPAGETAALVELVDPISADPPASRFYRVVIP